MDSVALVDNPQRLVLSSDCVKLELPLRPAIDESPLVKLIRPDGLMDSCNLVETPSLIEIYNYLGPAPRESRDWHFWCPKAKWFLCTVKERVGEREATKEVAAVVFELFELELHHLLDTRRKECTYM